MTSSPVREAVGPPSGVVPNDHLSHLVVDKDEQGPGHAKEPVEPVDWPRTQASVEPWAVAKEDSEASLKEQALDHLRVPHSLLEQGEP